MVYNLADLTSVEFILADKWTIDNGLIETRRLELQSGIG